MSSIFGGGGDAGAGNSFNEAVQKLTDLGVPAIEAQKIALQVPELAGTYTPTSEEAVQMGQSAFDQIEVNPALKQAQMSALNRIIQNSDYRAPVDRMSQLQLAEQFGQAQKGLSEEAAARGLAGSGLELQNLLESNAQLGQQGTRNALSTAAGDMQARMNALNNITSTAGGMRDQDIGQQSQAAQAQDLINQFNLQQRAAAAQRNADTGLQAQAFNLQNKQDIANQAADIANRQEMYNKHLAQQQFQNQMAKYGATNQALTNQNTYQNQVDKQKAQATGGMISGFGQLAGSLPGAISQYNKEK